MRYDYNFFCDDSAETTDIYDIYETTKRQEQLEKAILLEEQIKEESSLPEDDVSSETSGRKLLKRDIRKAAIARMEDSARTLHDFENVVAAWNREDDNRERRERYHEVRRDEDAVPLDFNISPDEIVIPSPIHSVYWHQILKGDFIDAIFDCPYEIHELVTDSDISRILKSLSEKHKALFFFLHIRDYSTAYLAGLYGQSDRNIRKVRATIDRKIKKDLLPILQHRMDNGIPLTDCEKKFLEKSLQQ